MNNLLFRIWYKLSEHSRKALVFSAILSLLIIGIQLFSFGLVRDSIHQTFFAFFGSLIGIYVWSRLPAALFTVINGWETQPSRIVHFTGLLLSLIVALAIITLFLIPHE